MIHFPLLYISLPECSHLCHFIVAPEKFHPTNIRIGKLGAHLQLSEGLQDAAAVTTIGCPAGSDRFTIARKLVNFTYLGDVSNLLINRGEIIHLLSTMNIPVIMKMFRYLKWRNPHLCKLYGYGLCKGSFPTPQNSRL